MEDRWQQPMRQVPSTNRNCLRCFSLIAPYPDSVWIVLNKSSKLRPRYSFCNRARALNKQKLFALLYVDLAPSCPHSVNWCSTLNFPFKMSSITLLLIELSSLLIIKNQCICLLLGPPVILTITSNYHPPGPFRALCGCLIEWNFHTEHSNYPTQPVGI